VSEPPDLISVRTEVVQEVLIPSLLEAAFEREATPLPDDVEAALARSHDPLRVRLARLGYLGRAVEFERFAPAREPAPWSAGADPAELAAREPLGKPRPDDEDAATWRVPGPGGHVRHFVAMRTVARVVDEAGGAEALPGGPESVRELKRAWVYGFLLRAAEDRPG
jgi:hypothetical protein